MDDLIKLLGETGIPFAYDHFAECESSVHLLPFAPER